MRHATHFLRSFQFSGLTRLAAVSVMLLAPAALALGQAAPAAPQTQPAPPVLDQVAPIEAAPTQPAEPPKIVVLPFETVGGKPGDSWIARSIQESVLTDLMTVSRLQVVTSHAPAADTAAAAELGHKLSARYVVFGQVHVNENSLRVTGQIVSTETDGVVGTLKATAGMNDLFTLEDVLSNEARGAVRRLEAPQTASAVQPQETAAIPPTGPVQVVPYPQDNGVPYTGTYDAAPAYPVAPYDAGYPYDYYPGDYYPYYPLYGGIGFGRGIGGRGFGGRGIGGRGIGGGLHGGGGGHAGGGHGGGGHR